jgi:hypothetical protein
VTPPPVVTPPDTTPPPPPPLVTPLFTYKLVVIPMQYQNDLGYAPKVTQVALTATFKQVSDWWSRETYGKSALAVTVLPELKLNKVHPGCSGTILTDATSVESALIYPGYVNGTYHPELSYDGYFYITTPGCWSGQMATGSTVSYSYSIYPDSVGKLIHEIGHQFGFGHTGGQLVAGGPIATYGSWYDQMGVGGAATGAAHFNAFRKWRLRALTPLPCADATLRNLESYPDAIMCNTATFPTWIEYHDDRSVFVHELRSGGDPAFGMDDNIWVARLIYGQSYKMADGRTLTHVGNGQVTIR